MFVAVALTIVCTWRRTRDRASSRAVVLNFADESACTKALGALGVQHDAQQCASWTESRDGGVRVRYVNHLDLPDGTFRMKLTLTLDEMLNDFCLCPQRVFPAPSTTNPPARNSAGT